MGVARSEEVLVMANVGTRRVAVRSSAWLGFCVFISEACYNAVNAETSRHCRASNVNNYGQPKWLRVCSLRNTDRAESPDREVGHSC
jgi:hypothetical protein